MKDALNASENMSGVGGKVLAVIVALTPPGLMAAIGIRSEFTLRDWLQYPACALLLWIFFLMLLAAFRKHESQQRQIKELEDAKSVKLTIERVAYQNSAEGGHLCRVTVRNLSTSKMAENVHVRMSGNVIPGIFLEGYSPFNEPDLLPASGSRSINPDSQSDWLFSDSFNHLAAQVVSGRINVVRTLYLPQTPEPVQTFSIEASAASSPPTTARFEIARDERGDLLFKKHPDDFGKSATPATI